MKKFYKNIDFCFKPFELNLSNFNGYGISILGFRWNGNNRAIGFTIWNKKEIDCDRKVLSIYVYVVLFVVTLKRVEKDHYICRECRGLVNSNQFCSVCKEYKIDEDLEFVINRK